ncbi:hypothetical protein [Streptomyces europaeiscabiei]|uniref:hypothetical protein n=1 Tax=Streptomyces europaeiscabiei TaxID=146819 RepID=UPI000A94823D|nr:hypothetical protein [Streptomyces europaeiscabiei]
MSAYEQPPLDLGAVCQRWRNRRHSWRPTGEGGFDPARYRKLGYFTPAAVWDQIL